MLGPLQRNGLVSSTHCYTSIDIFHHTKYTFSFQKAQEIYVAAKKKKAFFRFPLHFTYYIYLHITYRTFF